MSIKDFIKKPNVKSAFGNDEIKHLALSIADPIYFIENFIKVQHPTKGAVPLKLYPFQVDMVNGFANNRFVIALTARQMGKCVSAESKIKYGYDNVEIGSLVYRHLSLKDKLIYKLESLLSKLH
jgi:hypothetical protein